MKADCSGEQYCDAVSTALEYIRRGDIFQVVLSRRHLAPYAGDPLMLYRALRSLNPSPYLFLLRQGEVSVVGSSPEMLLRVSGRRLHYRPIAGTRPRGTTAAEDRRLEAELRADAKEIAEHIMLVDLGRNDLGRVSRFGSVQVDELMFVERYSHVMHLVSSLSGELAEGRDCFDALRACFPAGTVSGAPKIRAMEIIEELEHSHRGIYAGAVGYVDFSGNLDTCIAIRTIVQHEGLACIQAGAGIVADSEPRRELEECEAKAGALVQAVRLATAMQEGGL
jgi:anthranilate synthase component 1